MKNKIALILFTALVVLSSCVRTTCPTYTKDTAPDINKVEARK